MPTCSVSPTAPEPLCHTDMPLYCRALERKRRKFSLVPWPGRHTSHSLSYMENMKKRWEVTQKMELSSSLMSTTLMREMAPVEGTFQRVLAAGQIYYLLVLLGFLFHLQVLLLPSIKRRWVHRWQRGWPPLPFQRVLWEWVRVHLAGG